MFIDTQKKHQYLSSLQKEENQAFLDSFKLLLLSLIPTCYLDGECNWVYFVCQCSLKSFLAILIFGSLLGPYITLVLSIITGYYVISFISSISSTFFTFAFIGALGRGMCYCLYHPCNWFFLMVVSDLITLTGDIMIFLYDQGEGFGFNANTIVYLGNIVFVIIFFARYIILYRKLSELFLKMRNYELNAIFYCMKKILVDKI